jgi:hypothetical protein
MRKRYRVLVFAALVAALVAPVGYALSVESMPAPVQERIAMLPVAATTIASHPAAAAVVTPVAMSTGAATPATRYEVPDAAKLFGIGTVLFGLAAALRKAA